MEVRAWIERTVVFGGGNAAYHGSSALSCDMLGSVEAIIAQRKGAVYVTGKGQRRAYKFEGVANAFKIMCEGNSNTLNEQGPKAWLIYSRHRCPWIVREVRERVRVLCM